MILIVLRRVIVVKGGTSFTIMSGEKTKKTQLVGQVKSLLRARYKLLGEHKRRALNTIRTSRVKD